MESFLSSIVEWLTFALHVLFHIDLYLNQWISGFGPWIYAILFLILFCETGLVVTPFLPGDSLLFALGALSAGDGPLSLSILIVTLLIAAILGDAVNYWVGYTLGPRIFYKEDSIFLNKKHLFKTQAFYEKHGGKTIIIARFIPIVRTFAPFVAGIGKMEYRRFGLYNVTGAVAWVVSFLLAGFLFGNLPIIKRNFHIVILAIIVISVLPAVWEWFRQRAEPPHAPSDPHHGG